MIKMKLKKSRRDWIKIIIFFAFGLILISSLAWQIYLSDKLGGGYLSSEFIETDVFVKTINKDKLLKNIEIMEAKEKSFETIKNSKPSLIDPSF